MEKIKQVKPEDIIGPLHSSSITKRHPSNPIFTSKDVPYPSVIAYNAGLIKYQGQYVMVFRNDYNWNEEEQKAIGFQIGWLSIFPAVDIDPNRGKNGWEDGWPKCYTAGVMLQDLEDPEKSLPIPGNH